MSELAQTKESRSKVTYFNISSGEIVKGKKARAEKIDEGANPTDLQPVAELLYSEVPLDPAFRYDKKAARQLTEVECIKYGRWLLGIASASLPEEGRKTVNSDVLRRGWEMGLGPGPWTLRTQFGSISKFYKKIGANGAHRIGNFDNWGIEDYVRYLQKVGAQVGGRPTFAHLKELAHQNTNNPNPITIYKKYKDIGGINKIAELAGYTVVDLWENDDFVDWGVKFMYANKGLPPNARSINYLSRLKRGPSTFPIAKRFGSIVDFREQVKDSYVMDVLERKHERERKLADIEQGLESGELPRDIFRNCDSEDDLMVSYARYLVVEDLLTSTTTDRKISLAAGDTAQFGELGFFRSIKKQNDAITDGDIESAALSHSVFDELVPMSQDYMHQLQVPPNVGRRRVPNQYQKQLEPVRI